MSFATSWCWLSPTRSLLWVDAPTLTTMSFGVAGWPSQTGLDFIENWPPLRQLIDSIETHEWRDIPFQAFALCLILHRVGGFLDLWFDSGCGQESKIHVGLDAWVGSYAKEQETFAKDARASVLRFSESEPWHRCGIHFTYYARNPLFWDMSCTVLGGKMILVIFEVFEK